MTHVPYKGAAQALADVIGGQIDAKLDAYVSSAGHLADGTLRAIAVSSLTRLPELPDVPTVAEFRISRIRSDVLDRRRCAGRCAGTGTNAAGAGFHLFAHAREQSPLAKQGVRAVGEGHEALQSLIARELAQWQKLAGETDLTVK